jgi:transposase-like protein
MEERLRFVARLVDGESMSEVCRQFGISRKTGYKLDASKNLAVSGLM